MQSFVLIEQPRSFLRDLKKLQPRSFLRDLKKLQETSRKTAVELAYTKKKDTDISNKLDSERQNITGRVSAATEPLAQE